ncbi:MAG: excinuclease ABC subunit UvrC [Bacteroidales bacterium]|nr:excinuclease ABC subunit UvrC [Bacteroidales bacterium]
MPNADIHDIIRDLPEQPGVYQYYDADGKLLYIGKAKSLKKRVASYFNKVDSANAKLRVLVRKIARIEYVVVNSESDALLLENNLIKQYQPRYNILLKDDKTYPWICIKNERFPRLFSTRRYVRDGSLYFGPYTSGKLLHTLLALFKELFPIRTCSLALDQSAIDAGSYKPCLEAQIGNCLAPCIGMQTHDDYLDNIEAIKSILKGDIREVIRGLQEQMHAAAKELDFERAQLIKQKIDILNSFQSRTTIINPQIKDLEVYSILQRENLALVNMLKVFNGAIIQSYTLRVNAQIGEPTDEIFSSAISEIRDRLGIASKDLVLNVMPSFKLDGVSYSVPIRGDRKKLVELSLRNCFAYHSEMIKKEEAKNPKERQERILNTLMKDLNMTVQPVHIECFDNSNLQGTNPVASCVVFKNAKPSKRDYRHFMIKTVEGPNDFASMREVVFRRYHRLIAEQQPVPQLIVIDGGKGQLAAAMESIRELGLDGQVTVIGLAKRLEEVFFANDPVPFYLDKRSTSLKVIQHIRDEAHRFGVRLHTKRRSQAQVQSIFDTIDGVGPKSVEMLFAHFKSIDAIMAASVAELEPIIGRKRAEIVFSYFNKDNNT